MKRREFIIGLGSAAAWPVMARAQQRRGTPIVGFLGSASAAQETRYVESFRRGLGDVGFVEGRNVIVEYRWAEGNYERLPALAAGLVGHPVAVFVAGGVTAAVAAKAATATIPIVFYTGVDPVKLGLVSSLNKPDRNATGAVFWGKQLVAKQFEFLQDLLPKANTIAFLVNPNNAAFESETNDAQAAANALGQKLIVVKASSEDGLADAIAATARERAAALILQGDPFFGGRHGRLAVLAARHGIATMSSTREFPAAGGLMSYGASIADATRLVGLYSGRILKGEKPADLPVQQGTKVDLVINIGTAKTLGLTIPPSVLARADEVIE